MYLIFLILNDIFFALQESFISYNSFLNTGIIDNEIQVSNFISSVLILNIFKGVHNNFIVSAIPNNSCCIRIYNCNITYNQ